MYLTPPGWLDAGTDGIRGVCRAGARAQALSRPPSNFYKTATSRKQLLKQRLGNRPKSSTSLLSRDWKKNACVNSKGNSAGLGVCWG